ncbi:MAG: hypothetical protein HS111_03630 [Kofleriaceae bacterium]|nr:hypothetical protein [Kofleriaceae bacterium]
MSPLNWSQKSPVIAPAMGPQVCWCCCQVRVPSGLKPLGSAKLIGSEKLKA